MFAGQRRRSSNIRAMQLFHELKQQFPTVPDHVVTSCIQAHAHSISPNRDKTIRQVLEAAAALSPAEPMGRSPSTTQKPINKPTPTTSPNPHPDTTITPTTERQRFAMNDSESDLNRNFVKFSKNIESVDVCTSSPRSTFYVKRPDHLNLSDSSKRPFSFSSEAVPSPSGLARSNIQPSGKCKDVHKLLHSEHVVSDKPPRSPLTSKRPLPAARCSPLVSPDQRVEEPRKKETASTPTQTTDTLLGGNSVNLSLNVNCSMDVVQSPSRRQSVLQMTPQQPWLQEPVSPRSYTSVNLTLRPPSSEPQAPIDITSRNSSLTYSTSSFDSQKGLQSRLQITVGPGGGSVSSVRTRPNSSYHPKGGYEELVPVRAGSLNNLDSAASGEPPVIIKQQICLERLRIELRTEKTKLEVIQNEVADLERNQPLAIQNKVETELVNQLRKEIRHLRYQCDQLSLETDKGDVPDGTHGDFYQNLYTGQRGPLHLDLPSRLRRLNHSEIRYSPQDEPPKWNCRLCTFLNHPDLDKCEQCEMPKELRGKAPSNPNINYFPLNNNMTGIVRPIGFVLDDPNLFALNLNNNNCSPNQ